MSQSALLSSDSQKQSKGTLHRIHPDEGPTIQEAVDRAAPGDCVFLSPGTYKLTEPLEITKPLHIIGINGAGSCATLEFDGQLLKPVLSMLRIAAQSCRLKGLRLQYTHDEEKADPTTNAFAIFLVADSSATFDECTFSSSSSGIKVGDRAYLTLLCVKGEAQRAALKVHGRLYCDRCDFAGGSVCGIQLEPTASVTIESSCVSSEGCGIVVEGHGALQMTTSVVADCDVGVRINDLSPAPHPAEIKSCEIRDCGVGVQFEGEHVTAHLVKNFIHHCSRSGVLVLGGEPELRGNAVKECALGFQIGGGAPTLEGNVAQNCTNAGIIVHTSRPLIRGNEIVGNRSGPATVGIAVFHPSPANGAADRALECESMIPPFLVAPSQLLHPDCDLSVPADPTVEENVFGENSINVVVLRAGGIFNKNEMLPSSADNALVLAPQAVAVVFSNNDVLGSSFGSGIVVAAGGQCKIVGNSFSGTKLSAISLQGSGKTDVRGNTIDNCQDAVVAQLGAIARIGRNTTNGLRVDVFSDATDTVVIE